MNPVPEMKRLGRVTIVCQRQPWISFIPALIYLEFAGRKVRPLRIAARKMEQTPLQVDELKNSSQPTSVPTSRKASRGIICGQHVEKAFFLLLLSYISQRLKNSPKNQTRSLPTVYVDGLRGLFSFLVFVRHFLTPWEKDLDTGYAQGGNDQNRGILKLPIVRLTFSGPTVPIFFIVSGFVISYKPLKLIRKTTLLRARLSGRQYLTCCTYQFTKIPVLGSSIISNHTFNIEY
jgi:hypothetical protein